jgi:hypothetical protein
MDRVWLFVPGDRDIYVRQTLAAFPPEAIEKSVDLVGIEEWEIPDYAVKAVNREGRERSLLFFLLVFLWPVSFGLTNIWTYISFALMVVVVAAVTKAMMSCPCCRRLSLRKAESGNTVQCLECGISGDKSTE